jgi:hypothetical protein
MSPAPSTPLSTDAAPADGSSVTGRLRLKPATPVTGYVDGAWWPRSRDLVTELPALLADLEVRVGRVSRVGYHLGAWDPAPRRLPGGTVRLEGFRSTDPHLLTVVGRSSARIVLLVVPADTPDPAAQAALDAASTPGDRHSGAELLAGATGVASS